MGSGVHVDVCTHASARCACAHPAAACLHPLPAPPCTAVSISTVSAMFVGTAAFFFSGFCAVVGTSILSCKSRASAASLQLGKPHAADGRLLDRGLLICLSPCARCCGAGACGAYVLLAVVQRLRVASEPYLSAV